MNSIIVCVKACQHESEMKENELSKKLQQIEALIVNTNLQHLAEGVGACAFPEHDLDFIPDRTSCGSTLLVIYSALKFSKLQQGCNLLQLKAK